MFAQSARPVCSKYCYFTLIKGIIILLLVVKFAACNIEIEIVESPSEMTISYQTYAVDDACNDLPNGSYPDYYQACRMFYVCYKGKKIATFWCTKGYVFSLSSGHCEPPDRALCPDPNHMVIPLPADLIADDCAKNDGIYPDFSDGCSSFYICKGGVKTTFRCPDSTKFDWKTKSCRTSHTNTCHKLSCADKEDGLYIDSSSYCRRYFKCKSKNITEYVCPDGTIYNARHHRCTRSSTTRCPGSDTAQCAGIPDGYYPDFAAGCKVFGLCMNGGLKTFNCPANSYFDSKTLTCEANSQCPKPDVGMCTGKHNGIYPVMESGCKNFYLCLDGLLTHKGSCPQGKLLNPVNGNCQSASLVTCSPVEDPDCSMRPDGVYPDYDTGCSAYFICLGGRRVSTSYCGGNQLYDVATRKCLPSSFVLCRERSFISPPRLLDTYNCDNRLGLYPEFSSDCQRYIACAYGHKKYFNCSDGYFFDTESNICIKENKKCKAPFAVATFQCLPGDDGIYVDSNCSKWHECRNGVGFTNICPKRMYYDIKRSKCVENNAFCSSQDKIKMRAVGGGTAIPSVVQNYKFNCRSKEDGVYSDDSSCKVFHFCVQKKSFTYSCPSNFTYDTDLMMCAKSSSSDQCRSSRSNEYREQYFSCDGFENGMYSDFSTNCRRYFVCENGNAVPVYCPDGQKFNAVRMMCDKGDNVQCSPPGVYVQDPEPTKYTRQNDDSFHVYGPDELYTETYSYVPRTQATSRRQKLKDTDWDDYVEDRPLADKSPQPTDNHEIADYQSVPNSIQNEPATKRPYITKYHSTSPPVYMTRYQTTTPSFEDTTKYGSATRDRSGKLHQVRTMNRDLDAACRKGDTGFFPDYESGCKMFHICFRTIRKTYSCPSVLLFNPETKNCDLPENVVCTRPEPMLGETFTCKDNKMNQYVPDYSSGCKNYIGCINNLPYRFTCPKGKLFSHVTSVCESEKSYQCDYPGPYNITDFIASEEQSERFPIYQHVHGIPGHFYFSCSEKSDGFYPDYTRHCHVFYRCVRGKKFSHYCKQGLLFNPNSGICDFEENVVCKPQNTTTTSN